MKLQSGQTFERIGVSRKIVAVDTASSCVDNWTVTWTRVGGTGKEFTSYYNDFKKWARFALIAA